MPDKGTDLKFDVSVIIVTWNSEDIIKQCLNAVINNSGNLSVELIIIDNNSTDNTFSIINQVNYRNIQTYLNPKNIGFTKAVNQAIKLSSGKNILLLNPDAVMKDGCIDALNTYLNENEDYAACAPLLLNENGTIQYSVRNFPTYLTMFFEFTLLAYIFPRSKKFGNWKMMYYNYENDDDINQPMAAVLMIKREYIEAMDERFEMFFNDVDICKSIIDSCKKIRFIKSALAVHKHGDSIYKDRIRMIKVWNRDCVQYFKKYYPNPFLLLWLKINLKITEWIRILIFKISN
jgi:GT2 family glycosyltransferase